MRPGRDQKKGAAASDARRCPRKQQIRCDYTSRGEGYFRTQRRGDNELSSYHEKEEMRERVRGSLEVGRAPGRIRT